MVYFDWNPAHQTGIASIDFEHHQLVDALNSIHDLIEVGAPPESIGNALAGFHTTAVAHFALEERILQEERHPEFATRRQIHYRLLDEVREMMDAYEAGDFRQGAGLPATLRLWLAEAIEMDAHLFSQIHEAGLHHWGLRRG